MTLTSRVVDMFRCYRPPLIGPKPDLAYVPKDKGLHAELTTIGIYVRESNGREHIVPYANIESMRLAPFDGVTEIEAVDSEKPKVIKRGKPSEK